MRRSLRLRTVRLIAALAAFALLPSFTTAQAAVAPKTSQPFATPLFGMAAQGNALYVADSGAGVVKVQGNHRELVASLPGVTDVAFYGHNKMWAVGGPPSTLWRIVNGHVSEVANLRRFEKRVNPDGAEIDSNAFRVAALPGGRALVADAAANDLLIVQPNGHVDWVATLPGRLAYTHNAKRLAGCPHPSDPLGVQICHLPRRIPAESVATSIAVGPDGDYYVGELIGIPAPRRESRVWRIQAGTRHAHCGSSRKCEVALRGLTSIVDLDFAWNGALRVVEFDEASWFAVEAGQPAGGTVDSCNVWSGRCRALAHLLMPSAVASTRHHTYATQFSLVPGQAGVVRIG
jgi:hypothetical protein